jgi:hypothetical protein
MGPLWNRHRWRSIHGPWMIRAAVIFRVSTMVRQWRAHGLCVAVVLLHLTLRCAMDGAFRNVIDGQSMRPMIRRDLGPPHSRSL